MATFSSMACGPTAWMNEKTILLQLRVAMDSATTRGKTSCSSFLEIVQKSRAGTWRMSDRTGGICVLTLAIPCFSVRTGVARFLARVGSRFDGYASWVQTVRSFVTLNQRQCRCCK